MLSSSPLCVVSSPVLLTSLCSLAVSAGCRSLRRCRRCRRCRHAASPVDCRRCGRRIRLCWSARCGWHVPRAGHEWRRRQGQHEQARERTTVPSRRCSSCVSSGRAADTATRVPRQMRRCLTHSPLHCGCACRPRTRQAWSRVCSRACPPQRRNSQTNDAQADLRTSERETMGSHKQAKRHCSSSVLLCLCSAMLSTVH